MKGTTTQAEYIRRVVNAWPPLTDQQRTALAELLKPVRISAEAVKPIRGGGT